MLFCMPVSCMPLKITKEVRQMEAAFREHAGLAVYDTQKEKFIVSYQADRYFTPASNTKILTLFAALQVLGDSLPSLYYSNDNDSLTFWGTADPSLLDSRLPQSAVWSFLKRAERPLYFSAANFFDTPFGPGWAWDDYRYAFSAPKSPLPLFGNTVSVEKYRGDPSPTISPPFFDTQFQPAAPASPSLVNREPAHNRFYYSPEDTAFSKKIPFLTPPAVTARLLSDTLHKTVGLSERPLPKEVKIIYHPAPDSIYRVMMQQSDNLMAEQLLLAVGGVVSDSLSTAIAIDYVMHRYFGDAPDKPVWKDGSGLSRYNLMTPRFTVWLWHRLLKQHGKEKLFPLLAAGGQKGTLARYYRSDSPYLFGKTGTLSNNHTLSGFLLTAKGRLLIFSFMNSNYPTGSIPIKQNIEKILRKVYASY